MLENISSVVKSIFQFQKEIFKKDTRVLTSQALHLWLTRQLVGSKKSKKYEPPMMFI
jgi:hypothetical protein